MDARTSDADGAAIPSGAADASKPGEAGSSAQSVESAEAGAERAPVWQSRAPVQPEPTHAHEVEMGGEAACQLHRWWDEEED